LPDLLHALSRSGRSDHDLPVGERRSGDQLGDLRTHLLNPLRVDEIRLVDDDEPAIDAEQVQNLEVLVRLRHDPVVRRDNEHSQVDTGRPGDHHPHETLVTRHVNDADDGLVGPVRGRQRQPGEAEFDRHPAGLFLRQAIGIDAGQRLDDRGLAVIDMARRAENAESIRGRL
jgi:hypothetical protein